MKYLVFLPLFLATHTVRSQDLELRRRHYNHNANLAIEGYDPVSYFEGIPRQGNSNLKFTHLGIVYLFVDPSHLQKFKANPTHFEPAYGGWCAYAMGKTGEKIKVDPLTFKILNNRLFFFYNFWGKNTLKDWDKNEEPLKQEADQNWKGIFR